MEFRRLVLFCRGRLQIRCVARLAGLTTAVDCMVDSTTVITTLPYAHLLVEVPLLSKSGRSNVNISLILIYLSHLSLYFMAYHSYTYLKQN